MGTIYIENFFPEGGPVGSPVGEKENKEWSVATSLKLFEVCVGRIVCSCCVRDGSPKGQDLRLYAWLDSRQPDRGICSSRGTPKVF